MPEGERAAAQAMTTIRVAKRDRYTAIDRRAINDARLSFRARGVLAWLLDKPDDWAIRREALIEAGPEGGHAIRGALAELVAAGYLVRERHQDEGGKWVTESMLYEHPPEADNRPPVNRPPDTGQQLPITETNTEPKPLGPAARKGKASLPISIFASDANRLARDEWERREAKPVCGFPALRARVQEALEAGHAPEAIAGALRTMSVFSRNAFDFALGGGPRPAGPPRGHDAVAAVFDEIDRRTEP